VNFIRKFFLPHLIAGLYWIWSSTWKLKLKTHPLFEEACRNGSVIFAHWHGDEMVVVKLGPKYNGAAMTSTSKDGDEFLVLVSKWKTKSNKVPQSEVVEKNFL
jgi:lysophospholipid acyltransferase (LPLAT)-like uncharacterized protein